MITCAECVLIFITKNIYFLLYKNNFMNLLWFHKIRWERQSKAFGETNKELISVLKREFWFSLLFVVHKIWIFQTDSIPAFSVLTLVRSQPNMSQSAVQLTFYLMCRMYATANVQFCYSNYRVQHQIKKNQKTNTKSDFILLRFDFVWLKDIYSRFV